jgi:hypothetical protein
MVLTGTLDQAGAPGVTDNMISNPKPGSATGLDDSMADEFAEPVIIGRVRQPGMQWEPADKSPGSRVQGLASDARHAARHHPEQERRAGEARPLCRIELHSLGPDCA